MGGVSFYQTPYPNSKVVDRVARDKAALLLRRFAAGQITNDEFEDGRPISSDPAIWAMWDTACAYYSDTHEHKLVNQKRLHPDARRAWIRWLIFLDTDLSYRWPEIPQPGNDPRTLVDSSRVSRLKELFGMRTIKLNDVETFEQTGHYRAWPFVSQRQYRQALKTPRRLAAAGAK